MKASNEAGTMSPGSGPKPPNILLLFPDQHRGDWMPYSRETFASMGMEPLDLRMPNIESLMKRGVTFTRCWTPSPLCAPARACLASGLRYKNAGVASNANNYPPDQPTFYSALRDQAGYVVGGCGKFDLRKPQHYFGGTGWVPVMEKLGFTKGYAIDNAGKHDAIRSTTHDWTSGSGRGRRYEKPEDYVPTCPFMVHLKEKGLMMVHINDYKKRGGIFGKFCVEPTPLPDDAYCDNYVGRNAVKIIEKFPLDRPWFLQVNFVGPHEPWDVTERMRASVEGRNFPPPFRSEPDLEEALVDVRRNYAAMIENIDRNAGLIIDAIKARGELDNTIVVYSSDHGEMLGDFMQWGKSLPYRGSVHVPLVIAGPGIAKGIVSDALVELQDLVATFMDFAGCRMPTARESISLATILEGGGDDRGHRGYQLSALEKAGFQAVSDGRFKLIRDRNGRRLFDLEQDPFEGNDVSREHEDKVKELESLIDSS